jgi:tetratricopeptide (TPR) repeat protein
MSPEQKEARDKLIEAIGKLEQALEFYTRAWPSFEEHLGEAHPEAGALMSSIGIVQTQLLRLTEAATSLEKARAIQAAAHGSGHNEVAKTLANLGNVRLLQKRFDDAEQLFREALRIKEQCLGPSHAETGAELARLATCCVLQRRGKEAVELYDRALRIQESALGVEHVEVASTLGNLGRCLGRLGRLPEAEEACRRAAAIQARILGQNHPETRQSLAHLDNLANLGYPLQGKELADPCVDVADAVHEARGENCPTPLARKKQEPSTSSSDSPFSAIVVEIAMTQRPTRVVA